MDKETLIYGTRAVIEAIDSNESINRVFMQRGLNNKNGYELIKKLNQNSIEISYVPVEKLNRLTPKKPSRCGSNNFTYKLLVYL